MHHEHEQKTVSYFDISKETRGKIIQVRISREVTGDPYRLIWVALSLKELKCLMAANNYTHVVFDVHKKIVFIDKLENIGEPINYKEAKNTKRKTATNAKHYNQG